MPATNGYGQYTVNGKSVNLRWLEAGVSEVTVRNIGDATVATSGYYGVNGVLFDMNVSPYNVICYAMNNGAAVRNNGAHNGRNGCMVKLVNALTDGTTFFVKRGNSSGSTTTFTTLPFTHNGYTVTASNVQWALGGLSLSLSETMTESAFYASLEQDLSNTSNRSRTAIGYKGGAKIILCTMLGANGGTGCNLWDVRCIMKDIHSCTMGLNLDGGGSTNIS